MTNKPVSLTDEFHGKKGGGVPHGLIDLRTALSVNLVCTLIQTH